MKPVGFHRLFLLKFYPQNVIDAYPYFIIIICF